MLYRPPGWPPEDPDDDPDEWIVVVAGVILAIEFWVIFLTELARLVFHT